ncbi:MAG: antitoxin Xre/MbcA/ParS toxin-binding domain-containing protein [Parafilimonas sp.]
MAKKIKSSGKPSTKKLATSKEQTKPTNISNNVVNEDAAVYGALMRKTANKISGRYQNNYNINTNAILIDAAHKPENQMTALEKMDVVRLGITKKDLESLKAKARLGYDKLAKALSVTRATLINKKRQQKFSASLSERIISMADIYSYGYEVFEDEDRFNRWMFTPNQALGGEVPYELMDNQFGREEVRNIIGRIDYGVYS